MRADRPQSGAGGGRRLEAWRTGGPRRAVGAVMAGTHIPTHYAPLTMDSIPSRPQPQPYLFAITLGTAPVNHTPISRSAAPRRAMGHNPPIPMAVSTTSTAYQ